MIIRCVGEFLYGLAEFLFCLKYILVRTLILQCIKVTFHWSIIIRISGFAHALDHMGGLTEFRKGPGGILAPLITMHDQVFYFSTPGFQGFVQCVDRKVTGDLAVRYARHYASVIEIYDRAVISHFPVFQEQICEIRTPLPVRSIRTKILCQKISKYFM